MEKPNKEYLGDGAYVTHDGYQLCLTAENGIVATDTVYLEPSVLRHLIEYAQANGFVRFEVVGGERVRVR